MNRCNGAVWAFVFVAGMAATAQAQGTGLQGHYYDTQDFTGAVVTRLDATVAFNDLTAVGALPAGITDANNISIRWIGTVQAPVTGPVTFYFRCDDGSYLYVDGNLVTDQFRGQGIPNPGPTGIVNMTAGQRYSIVAEVEQGGGGVGAILQWAYTGVTQTNIPQTNLYPTCAPPKFSETPVTNPTPLPASRLITITCDTPGASITYTLNGGGAVAYTGPIVVTGNANFTATATLASLPGGGLSPVATANYTLTDTAPPSISQILSMADDRLYVTFNEPLNATGDAAANYVVTPAGPVVTAAARQTPGNRVVDLTITGLVAGNTYFLEIDNLTDNAGNAVATPETRVFVHRPPPSAGLVDLFRLDEGTGTTGADSSGNATGGNNGTLIGSTLPRWIPGRFGNALFFEGIRGEFQTAADMAPVLGGADASLSFWMRTGCRGNANVRPSNDVQVILGGVDGGANDILFGFLNANTGVYSVQAGDGAIVNSPTALNNNQWRHIAFTRAVGSGNVVIYVDGVSAVAAASEAGAKTRALREFGRNNGAGNYTHWNGALDDIRIYNRVITAAEVLDMYNQPPVVNAGPDQVIASGLQAVMAATATDDGRPTPVNVTYAWTQISGPGVASFVPNATTLSPTVNFTQGGTYVLRLTVNDSLLQTCDDVTISLSRVSVTPSTGLITTEAGGTDTFDVVLTAQPTNDVTITIASSDTTEGTVSTAQLTFTNANWNVVQTVTVTGVDDLAADGDVGYTIVTGNTVSTDLNFNGLAVSDVTATNTDDDTPGITVTLITPASLPLITNESGTPTATFSVVLNTQPTNNVTINITSTNILEGVVSTPMPLTFTAGNWNVAQVVTITGVDDPNIDLNQAYTIVIEDADGDAGYDNIDPADLPAVNIDDEVIPTAEAWGNCGLLGVEFLLGLGLAAALRRRAARKR